MGNYMFNTYLALGDSGEQRELVMGTSSFQIPSAGHLYRYLHRFHHAQRFDVM